MKGILYRSCHGFTDRKSGVTVASWSAVGAMISDPHGARRMIGSKDCREPVFVLMARGLSSDRLPPRKNHCFGSKLL